MCFYLTMVSVCTWNINGLGCDQCKLDDDQFRRRISSHDIVGIIESWTSEDEVIALPDYYVYNKYRNMSKNAKRSSGGILCYIKKSIRKGTTILGSKSPNLVWLKLDSNFFQFDKDIFLCIVYIPPESSPHLNNTWEIIEDEIAFYDKSGYVILSGDFNSRTGRHVDFIENDSLNHIPPEIISDYICDNDCTSHRQSEDRIVNRHGRNLLDLCISTNMRMLNGRFIGDYFGNFTYFKVVKDNTYTSTIDYTLVSEDLLQSVKHFCVQNFDLSLSDHCPISFDICNPKSGPVSNALPVPISAPKKLNPLFDKYIWDVCNKENFRQAFHSSDVKIKLELFKIKQLDPSGSDVDNAIDQILSVYHQAANCTLKPSRPKKRIHNRKNNEWFTSECKSLQRKVRSLSKSVHQNPKNTFLCGQLRKTCSEYKKCIRKNKKQTKDTLVQKLCDVEHQNPKLFWETIKKLTKTDSSKYKDADLLDSDIFSEHFNKISDDIPNDNCEGCRNNDMDNSIQHLFETCNTPLDYPISIREIKEVIFKLKNGKAVSCDKVSNEMIKYSADFMLPALVKLFNYILQTSVVPDSWKLGYITPIFKKKGDKLDPNNYRGITVTSSLGKVFSSVLNNRLIKYLQDNNIISDCQNGFKKGCRTSDNLFIIRTAVHKYLNMNKKVYCAFIDFQKAFDSVCHKSLFFKILSTGIGGKFFRFIKSLYTSMVSCVKFPKGLSENFPVKKGTRQGDILSPALFNLFINDVINELEGVNPTPLILDEFKLTALLYADDLAIFSLSANGLQICLNKLQEFCNRCHLKINIGKSKILIFEKSRKHKETRVQPKFFINQQSLEIVTKYTYLGTSIDYKGNFYDGIEILSKKGLKAMYVIMKSVNSNNIKPSIALKLFNAFVAPILTYNCEIWGISFVQTLLKNIRNHNNFLNNLERFPFEQVQTKFCKWTLGVNRYTSNIGTRGELGQYPLIIYIIKHIFDFVCHLQKSNNKAVTNALSVDKSLKVNSLFKGISNVIAYFMDNEQSNETIDENISEDLVNKLNSYYERIFFEAIFNDKRSSSCKNKLRTYRQFKKSYSMEKYITVLQNRQLRSTVAKFRLSNHELMIEKGRHFQLKPEKRLCPFNCNMVEDEHHFLLVCPKFTDLRNIYLNSVSVPYGVSSFQTFLNIMNLDADDKIIATAKFISNINKLRKTLLIK